jgi:hypothetical protein
VWLGARERAGRPAEDRNRDHDHDGHEHRDGVTVPAPSQGGADERAATPQRTAPRTTRARSVPAFRACDRNVTARVGSTSCAFAENVFWAYWHAWQTGASTFAAYTR